MSAAIHVDAVSLAIQGKTLLDRVSLDVQGGETIAIVGPNGAGKSTLLRLLSGDLKPTQGVVALAGRALPSYAAAELAARRAVLSQHVSVSFPFTVEEIVRMGAGDLALARAQPMVEAALTEAGLSALRDRELPTLSGGEQQRAHFARVLLQLACGEAAHGPGVLLLDEPTASLDLRHQIDLVTMAKQRAQRGTAVIAIMHDLNLAACFADRIVVLHRGRIAAAGPSQQTITAQMLREVFEVEAQIGEAAGLPAILPQKMTATGAR